MLTVAYVVAYHPEETLYEVPGTTDRPCSDCGAVLRVAPWIVGILERRPAVLLRCESCALKRNIKNTYHQGVTTSQARELQVYFLRN